MINFVEKRFEYYNSMGGAADEGAVMRLSALRYWMREECRDKGVRFVEADWKDYIGSLDVPRQTNMWDCGLFVCKYIENLARGIKATDGMAFAEADMPKIRDEVCMSLIKGRLVCARDWQ